MQCAYVWTAIFVAAFTSAGCDSTASEKALDKFLAELPSDGGNEVVFDCDDLPDLTDEELSIGPMSPPPLAKSKPTRTDGTPRRFLQLPDVSLVEPVADKMDQIDDAYFRRSGKHLTVTSGTRDPVRQAKAMVKMMRLGGDPVRLYRDKEAAREIKRAYELARGAKKSADIVVGDVYSVIQNQIARGVYISAHLRAGAVDARSRDMTRLEKKHFAQAVADVKGVDMLEEFTPPHFHLQID